MYLDYRVLWSQVGLSNHTMLDYFLAIQSGIPTTHHINRGISTPRFNIELYTAIARHSIYEHTTRSEATW